MQGYPLISIITPCFNAMEFLPTTVASVLAQTYPHWELLLIDDGSTDATPQLIAEFAQQDSRIKFLRNEINSGIAATRNKGINTAQGELVAFVDSDDVWLPEKLAWQVAAYQSGQGNFIIGNYQVIDEASKALRNFVVPDNIDYSTLLKGSFIGCLTVLVSKELVGSSQFKKIFHEDYVFWLELLAKPGAKLAVIRQDLASYRLRPRSTSNNKFKCAQYQWQIYRRHLRYGFFHSMYLFSHYLFKGVFKHYL